MMTMSSVYLLFRYCVYHTTVQYEYVFIFQGCKPAIHLTQRLIQPHPGNNVRLVNKYREGKETLTRLHVL